MQRILDDFRTHLLIGECAVPKPFSLREVADAFGVNVDYLTHYLDLQERNVVIHQEGGTGDTLAALGATEEQIAEQDEFGNGLDDHFPDRLLRLPDSFEVPELVAIREFARTQPPGPDRDRLVDATYGLGLYRRFKDEAYRQGLLDAWFAHRDRYFAEAARVWLSGADLPFVDDLAPSA